MSDAIVFLPLTQGKVAIIDFADFELVGRFKWHAVRCGWRLFYASRRIGKKHVYLHQTLLGHPGVDHVNGDGLDNRRDNLRPAAPCQNNRAFRRKTPGATSRFRGVFWHPPAGKWKVKIARKHLGLFESEEDAARAYDAAALAAGFFPEALNFPPPATRPELISH